MIRGYERKFISHNKNSLSRFYLSLSGFMKFIFSKFKSAIVLAVFFSVSSSFAQEVECKHTLFVSSGKIRSNMKALTNVSDSIVGKFALRSARETASDFCRALAEESDAQLVPESFKAILSLNSSGTIHADDLGKPAHAKNYIQIEGPVCNMNGEVIAATAAEFWSSSHLAKMNIDENGVDKGSAGAWTGGTATGVYSSSSCGGRPTCNCHNWTSTKDTSHGGNTGRGCAKDGRWSVGAWRDASNDSTGCRKSNGVHNSPCGGYNAVYCLGLANYIRARLPEHHGN